MAEIARGKRFSLLALDGYSIVPSGSGETSHRMTTSYCIVDRAYAHREVWSNYSSVEGRHDNRTRIVRRVNALAELDEFEAWAESVEGGDA